MLPGKKWTPDDALRILKQRYWLVLVPLFICTFAALVYSRFQPNLYRAEALIQIVPQRVPDAFVKSTVTTDLNTGLKAISQQIKSRTRLEQVIQELNLYPRERARKTMEEVVALMRRNISEELAAPRLLPGGQQQVDSFYIRFTYTDPVLTQRVTERLGSWIIAENSRMREGQAETTSTFLESSLAQAKANLEIQEQKLKVFRERYGGSLPTEVQSNMQAIQSLQLQLQGQIQAVATDQSRRSMVERQLADAVAQDQAIRASPLPTAPGTPTTPGALPAGASVRQRLEFARSDLQRLSARLTPSHPDIIQLKSQIADLEQKVAADDKLPPAEQPTSRALAPDEIQRRERISSLRAELTGLEQQIKFGQAEGQRLRAQIGTYQARLNATPGVESEWQSLSREVDTLNEAYRGLLTKYEEAKRSRDLEKQQIGEQFVILDPARVPDKPISPIRFQINAIGAVAGLVLGLGLIALLEFLDSSFKSETDVLAALALPVLATVPYMPTGDDRRRTANRRRLTTVAVASVLTICLGTGWFLQLWKYVV